jgi:hypothetical protein
MSSIMLIHLGLAATYGPWRAISALCCGFAALEPRQGSGKEDQQASTHQHTTEHHRLGHRHHGNHHGEMPRLLPA